MHVYFVEGHCGYSGKFNNVFFFFFFFVDFCFLIKCFQFRDGKLALPEDLEDDIFVQFPDRESAVNSLKPGAVFTDKYENVSHKLVTKLGT